MSRAIRPSPITKKLQKGEKKRIKTDSYSSVSISRVEFSGRRAARPNCQGPGVPYHRKKVFIGTHFLPRKILLMFEIGSKMINFTC